MWEHLSKFYVNKIQTILTLLWLSIFVFKLYLLNIDAKDRSIASLRTAEAFPVVASLRGREATSGNASAVHRLVNSELKRRFRTTHVNRNWSSCILEHCFCPNFRANRFCKSNALSKTPGGGLLPYITYTGMSRPTGS